MGQVITTVPWWIVLKLKPAWMFTEMCRSHRFLLDKNSIIWCANLWLTYLKQEYSWTLPFRGPENSRKFSCKWQRKLSAAENIASIFSKEQRYHVNWDAVSWKKYCPQTMQFLSFERNGLIHKPRPRFQAQNLSKMVKLIRDCLLKIGPTWSLANNYANEASQIAVKNSQTNANPTLNVL